ncbi:MAG: filamentous hemagglutinin N-terminal domain-containing protein [Symploca sp. SIO2B6]|nr:filamentous hemagglutinin N-terminal domain-containing protein [Symploca sp. SIO2B6]
MIQSHTSLWWQLGLAEVSRIGVVIGATAPGLRAIAKKSAPMGIALTGLVIALCENSTLAQIIPDASLGAESSTVTPKVSVDDFAADLIEGGAIRDSNLFHSFQEFNVQDGQRVYFSNPMGIENILSRVTGNNLSQILGTLGVDGQANLFFINPNGVVFGANAQLDIAGSLLVSTAESFAFEDGSFFSATNPQAPPLLTINLTPGLQYRTNQPRAITNQANLSVGDNLTLSGGAINSTGLLAAPKGKVRVEAVAGDAQIQNLTAQTAIVSATGNLSLQGNLTSSADPILRAIGDVSINNYEGASLHILAGGKVDLGSVEITGAATGNAGTDFIAEDITLSDGTTIVAIDGSSQPTLDVRAGMAPAAVGVPLENAGTPEVINPENPVLSTRTSADITVDSISINAPEGIVLLTNQYQADTSLPGGTITVDELHTDDNFGNFEGNAGEVFIDSRSGLSITDEIDASSASGNSGDITLIAQDLISLDNSLIISNLLGSGQGGDIKIQTGSLSGVEGSQIVASTEGEGNAGKVEIIASDIVSFSGRAGRAQDKRSGIVNGISRGAEGDSGGISINTGSLFFSNGAQIQARVEGKGNSGGISISARDTVAFDGVGGDKKDNINTTAAISSIESPGEGRAGDILIEAREFKLTNGADLQSNTIGIGDAGEVRILARERVLIDGKVFDRESKILSRVNESGEGNGGDIYIETDSIAITNGARLRSNVEGKGDAGNVTIVANSVILDGRDKDDDPSGIFSQVSSQGLGDGGDINIKADSIAITNDARLDSSTSGKGNAGNITLEATDSVVISNDGIVTAFDVETNILSQVNESGEGNGGDIYIEIKKGSISLTNGARLRSNVEGVGNAGNVTIVANSVVLDGTDEEGNPSEISSQVSVRGVGENNEKSIGGDINIEADSIAISNGARLDSSTSGNGNAGNITLEATDSVVISNDGIVSTNVGEKTDGAGGNITINTGSFSLIDGGQVTTESSGFIPALRASQSANFSYEQVVLADNPVGYWRLEETSGTTAFDSSGNNFNGTYRGGASQGVAGVSGTAAEFDGVSGAVDIGTIEPDSSLDIDNQSFTIEAWIKPSESPTDEQVYLGMHSNNQRRQSINLRVRDNGRLQLGFSRNREIVNTRKQAVSFGEGWEHIVFSYDAATDRSRVFVNAREIDSGDDGPFTGVAPSLLIGSWRNLSDLPFNGSIDEVAIYRRVLSPERIATHFDIGQISLGIPISDTGANAGKITVNADSINISGVSANLENTPSGLLADTTGEFGGVGGDIEVSANSLSISDGGVISAITSNQSNAGNILLQIDELLLLRNGGIISTEAGTPGAGGNGGNIIIDAGLIVAVPEENSDIIADAFEGSGGNINITTEGIFGILPQEQQTDFSAITASSESGIDGEVQVNQPDVDPSKGLTELTFELVDASKLVNRSCSPGGVARRSSFTVTGRGGLPPNPGDTLSSDAVVTAWVSLDSEQQNHYSSTTQFNYTSSNPRQIVEAQGWIKTSDGKVILTADASTVTPGILWLRTPACNNLPD